MAGQDEEEGLKGNMKGRRGILVTTQHLLPPKSFADIFSEGSQHMISTAVPREFPSQCNPKGAGLPPCAS